MSASTSQAVEETVAGPSGVRPRSRHDATSGSLARIVFALALPILGVTVLEAGRSAVELSFLGTLGQEALDTVITVNQTFYQLVMTFIIALAWGASALVSQQVGARDPAGAGRTLGQALGMMALFGVGAALVANFATAPLLQGVGMDAEAQARTAPYLRLLGFVAIVGFLNFGFSATLQATGDVVTPLLMVVVSSATNVAANWIFIFGPGPLPAFGALGVALAQATSAGLALSLGVMRVRRLHRDLAMRWWSFVPTDWGRLWRIARLAWPVWLQILCRAVGIILIVRLASRYGATARAGYAVGMRLDSMLINIGMAFTGAAATVVGQNVGARKFARAARGPWVAWGYYTAALLVFTALFWWKAEAVLRLFTHEPDVVAVGASFLRYTSAVYPWFAAAFVFSRAQQGAGDMWRPTAITLVGTFLVFVPLALWLPDATGLGVRGVFLANALALVCGGLMQAWFFLRGRWRPRGEIAAGERV